MEENKNESITNLNCDIWYCICTKGPMLYRRWLKGLGHYQLYIQFLNIKVRAKTF